MRLGATTYLLMALTFWAATALAQAPAAAPVPKAPGTPEKPVQGTSPQSVVPEAPYVPLSTRQKFHIFLVQTHSPYTFISAAMNATYDQMTGDPYDYGGGMAGFGRRVGRSLAGTESSRFFNKFLFASLFHQDPRYFPAKPHADFLQRLKYAASRTLVTRADSGRSQFNFSEVFGDLVTVSLDNTYYPDRDRGFGDTMTRFGGALLSTSLSNLSREFWPDIKHIFRKHEPKRMQKMQDRIEQRIPPSLRGGNEQ